LCDGTNAYPVFYYTASEQFFLIIRLRNFRSLLPSEPSKALAILLPAFSVSCVTENCEQQNRFLQPIQDSDHQGERNPRVFLKAKVIQASRQLNPDRDKIFSFPGQQPSNSNFIQTFCAKQFGFGARDNLTLDLNSSQNHFGANSSVLNSHFFGAFTTFQPRIPSAFNVYRQISRALIWQNLGVLRNNASLILISPLILCQTIQEDFGKFKLL